MKKTLKSLAKVVVCLAMVFASCGISHNVSADSDFELRCANNPSWNVDSPDNQCKSHCVETTLAGTQGVAARLKCDDPNNPGSGIKTTLQLVINVISILIAIIGVAAISIVGIQYLTAGSDIAKTVKAKARLIEIVIGLAIYAVLYALLSFLIPNF